MEYKSYGTIFASETLITFAESILAFSSVVAIFLAGFELAVFAFESIFTYTNSVSAHSILVAVVFTNAFIAGGAGPAFPAYYVFADQLAVDDVSFTAVLASPAFITLAHALFSTGASVVAFVGAFLELAEVSGVSGFASAFAV